MTFLNKGQYLSKYKGEVVCLWFQSVRNKWSKLVFRCPGDFEDLRQCLNQDGIIGGHSSKKTLSESEIIYARGENLRQVLVVHEISPDFQ